MRASLQQNIPERMEDALRRGRRARFSVVAMTQSKLIRVSAIHWACSAGFWAKVAEWAGCVVGNLRNSISIGRVSSARSNSGEMVVIDERTDWKAAFPSASKSPRFAIFEHVYLLRADSIIGGRLGL